MGVVRRGQLGLHDAGLFADPDLVQEHRGGSCAGTDQLGQRDGLLLAGDLHRDRCGGAAGAGAGRAGGPQGQKKDVLHLRGGAGHDLLRADGLCVELAVVPDPVCGDQDLLQRVADDLRFDAGRHHDGGPHGRGLLQRLCVGIPGVVHPVFDRADRLCAGAGHGRADSRAALARRSRCLRRLPLHSGRRRCRHFPARFRAAFRRRFGCRICQGKRRKVEHRRF